MQFEKEQVSVLSISCLEKWSRQVVTNLWQHPIILKAHNTV
jgi:hypothetical protein